MEKLFVKLHPRREPAGMELRLLRRMPSIFLAGTLAPALLSAAVRLWNAGGDPAQTAKQIASVDILVAALIVTFWTGVLTVSIACFIVFVMKGPAYVADAYPLDDAARPARRKDD